MWIIVSSIVLALVGVFASLAGLRRLTAADASRDPHAYWALGLIALLPAWLVAFVGLLGTTPGAQPHGASAAVFVLSAAAGLLGAIVTEARVRESGDSHEPWHPTRLWRLGLLAVFPAWLLALGGYAAS
jgi:NO-binding membrane sensor protein with MHYT domain